MDVKLITTCAVMHVAGPDRDERGRVCIGHCPACHQAVYDTDDPVWVCPTDLDERNPHHADSDITEAMRKAAGCYSNCASEFGRFGSCPDEDMPLHGECYESKILMY